MISVIKFYPSTLASKECWCFFHASYIDLHGTLVAWSSRNYQFVSNVQHSSVVACECIWKHRRLYKFLVLRCYDSDTFIIFFTLPFTTSSYHSPQKTHQVLVWSTLYHPTWCFNFTYTSKSLTRWSNAADLGKVENQYNGLVICYLLEPFCNKGGIVCSLRPIV